MEGERPGFPRPRAVEKAARERPLSRLADKPEQLLATILASPKGTYRRLAIGLLETEGDDFLAMVRRHAVGIAMEERIPLYDAVAEELDMKDFKSRKELIFLATHGKESVAERAVDELGRRDDISGLMAVSKTSGDDIIRDLAGLRMDESGAMVDAMLTAVRIYNKSGFRGHFKDFVMDRSNREGLSKDERRQMGFLWLYLKDRKPQAWDEFKTDISFLPILARVATEAQATGRTEDAREILQTLIGKRHIEALADSVNGGRKLTVENLMSHVRSQEWGDAFLDTVDEWLNIKDELIEDKYAVLHEIMGDELFLVDSEEEFLMVLLPDELKGRITQGIEEQMEVLMSPLLTENEKERITGMNRRVARVALNLGLIEIAMPSPFGDAEAFERHVMNTLGAIRPSYSDGEFRSIAVNRVLTAVMEETDYQKSTQKAEEALRRIGGTVERQDDGSRSVEREVIDEAFRKLRCFIDYHKEHGEDRGIDFYQSLRIKAFLDHDRILVADGTGTGKTIVALGAKCAMDREKGRRSRMLVLAPSTGTEASWGQQKINEYCSKFNLDRQKVVIIDDRRYLKDLGERIKDADIVVLGYGRLSIKPDVNEYLPKLFEHDFDAVAVDECHNIKNFESFRGQCAKLLINHYKDRRMLLLSATPLPNSIDDGIGMLLFALDPEKYPNPESYTYNNDPERVREMWLGQRWFRLTLEDIREDYKVTERDIEVNLHDDEAQAYFDVWKECAYMGFKMPKLQRMLIDSRFAAKFGATRQAKLEELDRIVEGAMKQGCKVVIWTPWVEGVVSGLRDRYGEHGSISIDGSIKSPLQRYRIANSFRESSMLNVMVISRVADEAIDLSCGMRPVVLVRLVPPITPREDIQTKGRVGRREQKGHLTIITLSSKSEKLTRQMLAFVNDELPEHGLSAPREFMAQTIDRDVAMLLRWKNQVTSKVFRAEKLTRRQLSIWKVASPADAKRCLSSSLHRTTKDAEPFTRAIFFDHKLRNAGAAQVEEVMDGNAGISYARLYDKGWEGSHSQHTLELIASMVRRGGIEGKGIVDFGGGAAYASRVLRHPTMLVDLNEEFLRIGKEVCERMGIDNIYLKSDMRKTGIRSSGQDAVIASYSFHHLKQTPKEREVEEAILEANRILQVGGTLYITFPWSVGEEAVDRFRKGLKEYGFSLAPDSGVYMPVFENKRKKGQKILLLAAQKVKAVAQMAPSVEWENFQIFTEGTRKRFSGDHEKKEKKRKKKENDRAVGFRKMRSFSG
jgi:superfamily II DNA or RNA helicase/ubiquinone/menaquinone biosynthesis C-methylase UbiE